MKTWDRIEMALPFQSVRVLPKAFVVEDEDLKAIPPLPTDEMGVFRYKGIPVYAVSQLFFVEPKVFQITGDKKEDR